MCGIVGYTGTKPALSILIDGLKRLEYRGYDSAGVCVSTGNGAFCMRSAGRVSNLEGRLNGNLNGGSSASKATSGIAHTRWATHGSPTEANAHPHADCLENIFVVHNGIIENYRELREQLEEEGHAFRSETDTEVLSHLIEKYYDGVNLEDALLKALAEVSGTFGIGAVSAAEPGKIVAARRSSPLLVGIGPHEYFIASDVSAVMSHTRSVVYLDDDEIAVLTPDGYSIRSLDKTVRTKSPVEVEWSGEEAEKCGYPHFMLKEIHEAPETVENACRGRILEAGQGVRLGGLAAATEKLRSLKRLIITSCGTSYYAGLAGAMMIEEFSGLPVEVYHASEYRYRKMPNEPGTGILAISQSGETADTLAAVRLAKHNNLMTLGLVNVVGSSIARETDTGIYNHAGPEIGVASTKAFVSQLTVMALLAVYLGRMRGFGEEEGKAILKGLACLPSKIRQILAYEGEIRSLAEKYARFENFLYIGRKYQYPTALEGALKLKEISYIHAEGYAAGEMKHGPIALITPEFPTVAIIPSDTMYAKTLSNMQEIKARGGPLIAVATQGNSDMKKITSDVLYIPESSEMLLPILAVVPLQLFAYYVAVARGCDVDKPRNLAKSVTVE
jgi:glutamine---fructose-6-phosphate transaminase (isomerizing)